MHRLCDKKLPIFIIFLVSCEVSWQTVWIRMDQLLKKLADQYPTVYHAAYVMLYGLIDMIVTCFSLAKNSK